MSFGRDSIQPLHRRPLPVTIVVGMPVVEVTNYGTGSIAGMTQAYCIYRLAENDSLVVASWRDIALGNVCPAEPLLPTDVTENDRRNAGACVLRELLALQQFGLTPMQAAIRDELIAALCVVPQGVTLAGQW